MELIIHKDSHKSDSLMLPAELVGIGAPEGWTTAPLCFRVSKDGVTYEDLRDENVDLVEIPVQPPGTFMEVKSSKPPQVAPKDEHKPKPPYPPYSKGLYMILMSGTPDAPVDQAEDRVFHIYTLAPAGKAGRPPGFQENQSQKDASEEHREKDRQHQEALRKKEEAEMKGHKDAGSSNRHK